LDQRPELVHAAFRELHADRLHGFALLVTLGDRRLAAELATDALDAAAGQLDRLRHPERAAAWLRARAIRLGRRAIARSGRQADAGRRRSLDELGVSAAAEAGLAALDPAARAALIAAEVERLSELDAGTIAGVQGARLARLLRRARARYARAYAAAGDDELAEPGGPVTARILDVAARALQ
jgi:DNA-directed RNA polymerase specialized sigma24 family protein